MPSQQLRVGAAPCCPVDSAHVVSGGIVGGGFGPVFWSLPIIVVAVLVASGRAGSMGAGLGGTLCALVVAFAAAPVHFDPKDAALAVAKGIWLAWLVGAVIL